MNKNTRECEQKPGFETQQRKADGDVTEGRSELAHLIGRLLARRWLKEQCPPASSARSTSVEDDGNSY